MRPSNWKALFSFALSCENDSMFSMQRRHIPLESSMEAVNISRSKMRYSPSATELERRSKDGGELGWEKEAWCPAHVFRMGCKSKDIMRKGKTLRDGWQKQVLIGESDGVSGLQSEPMSQTQVERVTFAALNLSIGDMLCDNRAWMQSLSPERIAWYRTVCPFESSSFNKLSNNSCSSKNSET